MSCTELRPLLPAVVYGDLTSGESARIAEHLTSCSACRRELAALERVRRQLDGLPSPNIQIDLPRLYQQAARGQKRSWRRWVIAGASVAAAVLVGLFALNLEVRIDGHQLVLRWGTPPPMPIDVPSDPPSSQPVVLVAAPEAEERMKLLGDLVNALARDAEHRDTRHKEEIAKLQARVSLIQRQATDRLAATERDVAALYNVQFNPNPKGADQ